MVETAKGNEHPSLVAKVHLSSTVCSHSHLTAAGTCGTEMRTDISNGNVVCGFLLTFVSLTFSSVAGLGRVRCDDSPLNRHPSAPLVLQQKEVRLAKGQEELRGRHWVSGWGGGTLRVSWAQDLWKA